MSRVASLSASAAASTAGGTVRRIWPSSKRITSQLPPRNLAASEADPAIVVKNYLALREDFYAWNAFQHHASHPKKAKASALQLEDYLGLLDILASPNAAPVVLGYAAPPPSGIISATRGITPPSLPSKEYLASLAPIHASSALSRAIALVASQLEESLGQGQLADPLVNGEIRAQITRVFGGSGQVAMAVRYAKHRSQRNKDEGSRLVLESINEILCGAGRGQVGDSLLSAMDKEDGLRPTIEAYGNVIASYGRAGNLREARALFNAIAPEAVDSPTLDTMIHTYAKAGDIGLADKYFNEYHYRQTTNKSFPKASTDAWTGMIRAHSVRGNLGEAGNLYRRMRMDGLAASERTLEYLILGHANAKDIRGALRFFYKKENVLDFRPDTGMCAALVHAHTMVGDVIPAWRLIIGQLDDRIPPYPSTSPMPDTDGAWNDEWVWLPAKLVAPLALSHSGIQIDLFLEVLRWGGLDINSDLPKLKAILTATMQALMNPSLAPDASPGAQPDAKTALIIFKGFERFDRKEVPTEAYAEAIKAHAYLASQGDAGSHADQAAELLQHLMEAASEQSRAFSNNKPLPRAAFDGFIAACAWEGNLKQALDVLKMMVDSQSTETFADHHFLSGLSESADSIPYPDASTFEAVLMPIAQKKLPEELAKDNARTDLVIDGLVEEMVGLGVVPSPSVHPASWKYWANATHIEGASVEGLIAQLL
ncbi:hypothetical protein BJ742DRAFT_807333 [Cladochytrium replicatum]|nr:hypothetical protein BJ742DRAFT_807333 [Cladochytrium replicatum]